MIKTELELFRNGVIIKKANNSYKQYLGVEGDNWFIDLDIDGVDKNELKYLYNYYCDNIDKSWEDNGFTDCCVDIEYINRYAEVCKKANIDFMILFCETQNKFPQWQSINNVNCEKNLEFLGYDYAYAGGSFYSCIYNDVLSGRIPELSSTHLNQYGLIKNEDEMMHFIKLREHLKLVLPLYTFEEGDFIIYKLWRYTGNTPLSSKRMGFPVTRH